MQGWINLGFFRFYWRAQDWAGLGYPHRMVAWTDRAGYPRSLVWGAGR